MQSSPTRPGTKSEVSKKAVVVPRSTARHRCSMAGDAPTRGTQFDVCRATAHPAIRLRSARLAQYRNHHGFPSVQDPHVIPTPSFPSLPSPLSYYSMRFLSSHLLSAPVSTSFHPQTGPLNREILKNAFNFPLSSSSVVSPPPLVIRLGGDRPADLSSTSRLLRQRYQRV